MGDAMDASGNTQQPRTEASWIDKYWESSDGLTLHFRDYPGREDRPAILCLPGLTRNARDFEPVADAFAGEWRVICVEFRGRGESDYAKDTATYMPANYLADLDLLIAQEQLDTVVALGTSLGGLVTMMLAATQPDRLAGYMLNDIGPVIDPAGLERIRDYVGQGRSFPTWMHAARSLRESSMEIYPDFDISDWLVYAKRLMCLGENGRVTLDYDMKIAEPFSDPSASQDVDMWPLFRALGGRPGLALRGDVSDILADATLRKMAAELPDLETVTVPRVGHTPTLEEPVAQDAIARLLGKVAAA